MLKILFVAGLVAITLAQTCEKDTECSTEKPKCDVGTGSFGQCTDGKTGSYCELQSTCTEAGEKCLQPCSRGSVLGAVVEVCTAGTCGTPAADGASCTAAHECASNYCSNHLTAVSDANGKCEQRKAAGAACQDDSKSAYDQRECATNLYCTAVESGKTNGVCSALKKTGDACEADAECEGDCDTETTKKCTASLGNIVGMGMNIIIGVAVGGVVLCCCCCFAIWFFVLKGRK
jgi:hypothetical protein